MDFHCRGEHLELDIAHCVVAGWTARDRGAIEHHIEELAALGVKRPSTVPLFYRVSSSLLCHPSRIQVLGRDTSGEVEPLVIEAGERRWIGLASDHTDRKLERRSVAASKQAAPKPCARELWPLDSVIERLDALELTSWILDGGDWRVYQQGTLASIRPLPALFDSARATVEPPTGGGRGGRLVAVAMLGGTLPVLEGGIRPASAFRMRLQDPETGASIEHAYRIDVLPEVL